MLLLLLSANVPSSFSRLSHLLGGVQQDQHTGDPLFAQLDPGVQSDRADRPHHVYHPGSSHDFQGPGPAFSLHYFLRGAARSDKALDLIIVFFQVLEGFIFSVLLQNCLVLQPTWPSPTSGPAPSPCSSNLVTTARPPFPVGLSRPRQDARCLFHPNENNSVLFVLLHTMAANLLSC